MLAATICATVVAALHPFSTEDVRAPRSRALGANDGDDDDGADDGASPFFYGEGATDRRRGHRRVIGVPSSVDEMVNEDDAVTVIAAVQPKVYVRSVAPRTIAAAKASLLRWPDAKRLLDPREVASKSLGGGGDWQDAGRHEMLNEDDDRGFLQYDMGYCLANWRRVANASLSRRQRALLLVPPSDSVSSFPELSGASLVHAPPISTTHLTVNVYFLNASVATKATDFVASPLETLNTRDPKKTTKWLPQVRWAPSEQVSRLLRMVTNVSAETLLDPAHLPFAMVLVPARLRHADRWALPPPQGVPPLRRAVLCPIRKASDITRMTDFFSRLLFLDTSPVVSVQDEASLVRHIQGSAQEFDKVVWVWWGLPCGVNATGDDPVCAGSEEHVDADEEGSYIPLGAASSSSTRSRRDREATYRAAFYRTADRLGMNHRFVRVSALLRGAARTRLLDRYNELRQPVVAYLHDRNVSSVFQLRRVAVSFDALDDAPSWPGFAIPLGATSATAAPGEAKPVPSLLSPAERALGSFMQAVSLSRFVDWYSPLLSLSKLERRRLLNQSHPLASPYLVISTHHRLAFPPMRITRSTTTVRDERLDHTGQLSMAVGVAAMQAGAWSPAPETSALLRDRCRRPVALGDRVVALLVGVLSSAEFRHRELEFVRWAVPGRVLRIGEGTSGLPPVLEAEFVGLCPGETRVVGIAERFDYAVQRGRRRRTVTDDIAAEEALDAEALDEAPEGETFSFTVVRILDEWEPSYGVAVARSAEHPQLTSEPDLPWSTFASMIEPPISAKKSKRPAKSEAPAEELDWLPKPPNAAAFANPKPPQLALPRMMPSAVDADDEKPSTSTVNLWRMHLLQYAMTARVLDIVHADRRKALSRAHQYLGRLVWE